MELSTKVKGVTVTHRVAAPPLDYVLRFPECVDTIFQGAIDALAAKVEAALAAQ